MEGSDGSEQANDNQDYALRFEDLTVDDDLPLLDRIVRYCRSGIALQRLVHVKMLAETAETVGWVPIFSFQCIPTPGRYFVHSVCNFICNTVNHATRCDHVYSPEHCFDSSIMKSISFLVFWQTLLWFPLLETNQIFSPPEPRQPYQL